MAARPRPMRFAWANLALLLFVVCALVTGVAGLLGSSDPFRRHGHGFPARLVVPDQRGFDWVKWVARIAVLESSHLLQPPLPLE